MSTNTTQTAWAALALENDYFATVVGSAQLSDLNECVRHLQTMYSDLDISIGNVRTRVSRVERLARYGDASRHTARGLAREASDLTEAVVAIETLTNLLCSKVRVIAFELRIDADELWSMVREHVLVVCDRKTLV